MSNERILILTDDNKDKTNLVQKLKSWDYLPFYFQIKSHNIPKSVKPDLILVDINHNHPLKSINNDMDVIKNYDVPLIYMSDNSNWKSIKSNRLSKEGSYIQKPL